MKLSLFVALLISLLLTSTISMAHGLRVFASVEGNTVNVEAKFSNGRLPVDGEVRVFDASDALIAIFDIDTDGITSFPLMDSARESGLRIEVTVSEGHTDYWILTPDDIVKGQS